MIINLKEAVLDYRPGKMDPWSQKNRIHALEVLNYIEKVENLTIIPKFEENSIKMSDLALLLNFEYKLDKSKK